MASIRNDGNKKGRVSGLSFLSMNVQFQRDAQSRNDGHKSFKIRVSLLAKRSI